MAGNTDSVKPMEHPEAHAMDVLNKVAEALESLGFESVVICVDGSEPFVSMEIDAAMGLVLDLTATLKAWCEPYVKSAP